ncbi:bifunctional adenosylcobinamide kinase/adenosylcobinamide-phosphate guanylyltransferase [Clostridium beijerinckii]|uniref:bifunctional adenosylcobinamide kinase/adenosylcobinamide-phosphate guanylyltransferase n=1 Tax=Clostridium beijerinckii TaxID=1520 RepID=UPI00098CB040|nr:bifunctional adenosylcobinamide kinase/adenosylcobinamide-phosphate guanylyltransferase [Clostridium beijerinckii]MBA8936895.1 hypothetical protein [Clostridium beijerinckii]NRT33654.1 hypothetical protein [Clostridium beijerinckii]NRT46917.1 hypothetical protein [Clostridium beijerinckii]NRU40640.1 hypothetical protein [Clostridium beijerinckii]NRZ19079.1 hypothetical protein [Clostridium beijerinckii]
MKLIFGGAYNGKLDYVKEKYKVSNEQIFFCRDENIEYNKEVICGLHIFVKACVSNKLNPIEVLKDKMDLLENKIIICDEINSGIVPIEKFDRIWREETGRLLQFLAKHSSHVYRIFFGIEEELKNNTI